VVFLFKTASSWEQLKKLYSGRKNPFGCCDGVKQTTRQHLLKQASTERSQVGVALSLVTEPFPELPKKSNRVFSGCGETLSCASRSGTQNHNRRDKNPAALSAVTALTVTTG